jgi:predicted DNA-binding ribbon-helix-helix protein
MPLLGKCGGQGTTDLLIHFRAERCVMKRSIVIARHKASIRLEEPFWTSLHEIARARSRAVSNLVVSPRRRWEALLNITRALGLSGGGGHRPHDGQGNDHLLAALDRPF